MNHTVEEGEGWSELELRELGPGDVGRYSCAQHDLAILDIDEVNGILLDVWFNCLSLVAQQLYISIRCVFFVCES